MEKRRERVGKDWWLETELDEDGTPTRQYVHDEAQDFHLVLQGGIYSPEQVAFIVSYGERSYRYGKAAGREELQWELRKLLGAASA